MTTVLGILVLAFIGEAIVEYLLKDHLGLVLKTGEVKDLVSKYAAALVGVALCILYQVDVVALVGPSPVWQPGAFIVTGLLIGRGSNFVYDFEDVPDELAAPHLRPSPGLPPPGEGLLFPGGKTSSNCVLPPLGGEMYQLQIQTLGVFSE